MKTMADKHDLLVWGAFFAAIFVGGLIGFVNGLLVVRIGIPSIIATLATLFVWEGATVVSSGGLSHNIRGIKDYVIYDVLTGRVGAVPVQIFWAIGLAVLMWFILNRHRFGEHLLFIGDNANVARVVGVKVDWERIKLFTLMGVLGALSGVILTLENKNFLYDPGAQACCWSRSPPCSSAGPRSAAAGAASWARSSGASSSGPWRRGS